MDRNLRLAKLAGTQRGLLTAAQLVEARLSSATITRWSRSGRPHRLFRGVYLLGHAVPPPLGLELAAMLACGPTAVLSHHTAARRHGLSLPGSSRMHITVPGRRCRPQPGLLPHAGTVTRNEVRTIEGLRVTSPARTLQDCPTSWIAAPTSVSTTRPRSSGSSLRNSSRRASPRGKPNAASGRCSSEPDSSQLASTSRSRATRSTSIRAAKADPRVRLVDLSPHPARLRARPCPRCEACGARLPDVARHVAFAHRGARAAHRSARRRADPQPEPPRGSGGGATPGVDGGRREAGVLRQE